MLHMLQVFQINIASVCSKYFIYFGRMFASIFYLDVAYVSHTCCKSMFQMFHLSASVFMLQVISVLKVAYITVAIHVYCKCMLQMFQLFSEVCCKCFI